MQASGDRINSGRSSRQRSFINRQGAGQHLRSDHQTYQQRQRQPHMRTARINYVSHLSFNFLLRDSALAGSSPFEAAGGLCH
jgi:hypothetical protein